MKNKLSLRLCAAFFLAQFLVSCPAIPDLILRNTSGMHLIVRQGKKITHLPDNADILIGSKKGIQIYNNEYTSPNFTLLIALIGGANSPECKAYGDEIGRSPFPHKMMAVIMPDKKIYIQQQNLPRPFRNQPLGFPVQMIPKASP